MQLCLLVHSIRPQAKVVGSILASLLFITSGCGEDGVARTEAESPRIAPEKQVLPPAPPPQEPVAAVEKADDALRGYVTGIALNVRSGPGASSPVVGILLKYDEVTLTESTEVMGSTWYAIDAAGGYVDGWVSGSHLEFGSPPEVVHPEVDYGAQETPTLSKGPFQYVGAGACKSCHVESTGAFADGAYSVWQGHLHSEAFRSLSRQYTIEIAQRTRGVGDPTTNWRCVKCHVTAYGARPEQLAATYEDSDGVGCEVCHGPGSAYADIDHGPGNPQRYELGLTKLTDLEERRTLCVRCHNKASPTYKPFNVLAFSREIQHWPDPDEAAYFAEARHAGQEREERAEAEARKAAEEQERADTERAETERIARAEAEAERRAEAERIEREESEARRAELERAESAAERVELERKAAAERAEAERRRAEAEARERAATEKAEAAERAATEQAEAEKLAAAEKAEAEERAAAEKAAQEALERKKEEAEAQAKRQTEMAEEARSAARATTGVDRHLEGLPDDMTLNENGKKYQTVRFTHSAHATGRYSAAGLECATCHHTQEGDDKPEPCSECHSIDGDADETRAKTNATHKKEFPFPKQSGQEQVSCVGCHKSQNAALDAGERAGEKAPTKCSLCHKKKGA